MLIVCALWLATPATAEDTEDDTQLDLRSMGKALKAARKHVEAERPAAALRTLEAAVTAFPESKRLHEAEYRLARVHQLAGDCGQAIQAFESFLAAHATSRFRCHAFLRIAQCHETTGQTALAEAMYRRASMLECERTLTAEKARQALGER